MRKFLALVEDLTQLNTLMPPVASKKLQAGTALWVNKTLTFGTAKKPIQGLTLTITLTPMHKVSIQKLQ
jgi:hypothetical protein